MNHDPNQRDSLTISFFLFGLFLFEVGESSFRYPHSPGLVFLLYLGPFKCYVMLFSWEFYPHPPPRNANNVEPYTFVTLFSGKADTPPNPSLRYVTLEWPFYSFRVHIFSYLITSLRLSFGHPIFRCPPTSIIPVLITTSSSIFLSTWPNHLGLASLIF